MILQADKLVAGELFGFMIEVLTGVVPIEILALLIFGSIGTGYYMVQGTAIMPLIMFILIGSVTILEGPVSFTQGIVAVFIVAITGIAYIIVQRFNTG